MLKNTSIKVKLLTSVIVSILIISVVMVAEIIVSLKHEAKVIIDETSKSAYERKQKELENYVSLAYKTVESYYDRTSKEKIKGEVEAYITEQSSFLFSIIEAEYEKNKNTLSEKELKERISSIIKK